MSSNDEPIVDPIEVERQQLILERHRILDDWTAYELQLEMLYSVLAHPGQVLSPYASALFDAVLSPETKMAIASSGVKTFARFSGAEGILDCWELISKKAHSLKKLRNRLAHKSVQIQDGKYVRVASHSFNESPPNGYSLYDVQHKRKDTAPLMAHTVRLYNLVMSHNEGKIPREKLPEAFRELHTHLSQKWDQILPDLPEEQKDPEEASPL